MLSFPQSGMPMFEFAVKRIRVKRSMTPSRAPCAKRAPAHAPRATRTTIFGQRAKRTATSIRRTPVIRATTIPRKIRLKTPTRVVHHETDGSTGSDEHSFHSLNRRSHERSKSYAPKVFSLFSKTFLQEEYAVIAAKLEQVEQNMQLNYLVLQRQLGAIKDDLAKFTAEVRKRMDSVFEQLESNIQEIARQANVSAELGLHNELAASRSRTKCYSATEYRHRCDGEACGRVGSYSHEHSRTCGMHTCDECLFSRRRSELSCFLALCLPFVTYSQLMFV